MLQGVVFVISDTEAQADGSTITTWTRDEEWSDDEPDESACQPQ
jgi:hypothetical protein